MRKKTYIQPQMEAVEIKMQGLIASSPGYGGGGGGGGDAPVIPDFDDTDKLLDFNWTSGLPIF